MRSTYIIILSLVLYSCNRSNTLNSCQHEETFIHIYDSCEKINCEWNNNNIVALNDLTDSVKIIKLETNDSCLIGEISEVIFWKDRIFIGDYFKSKSIFIFTMNGKFIKKVNKIGKAPNEYLGIHQMGFNNSDSCIFIMDLLSRKIISFNYFGEIINEESLNLYTTKVEYLKSGNKLFYNGYRKNSNEACNFNLLSVNDSNKILEKGFPFTGDKETVNNNYCFQSIRDGINFYMPQNGDTIYLIKGNRILSRYKISFGDKSIPVDFLEKYPKVKSQMKVIEKSDFFVLNSFFETANHLFFTFSEKYSSLNFAVYYKSQHKLVYGKLLDYNNKIMFDFGVNEIRGDKLITIIDPTSKMFLDKFDLKGNHSDRLNQTYLSMINNMNDVQNPLILIRVLKTN